jgi:hypothetical protein
LNLNFLKKISDSRMNEMEEDYKNQIFSLKKENSLLKNKYENLEMALGSLKEEEKSKDIDLQQQNTQLSKLSGKKNKNLKK